MRTAVLEIRRLGYAMGAQITGLDLRERVEDDTIAEIRNAWLEHVVLCFPGQNLTPAELNAFAARFGTLNDNRNTPHLRHPDYETIHVMVNNPVTIGDRAYGGIVASTWHTDYSYTTRGGSGTFLVAKKLPDVGGDTLFANMYSAYEALSAAYRDALDGLSGIYDMSYATAFGAAKTYSAELQAERKRLNPPVVHRLIRIHPETGRRSLYLDQERLRGFVGMTDEESRALLDFLNPHATRPEFTYRHRWTADDLVIWDNRCAMHCAVTDYDRSQLRQMIRCALLPPETGTYHQG